MRMVQRRASAPVSMPRSEDARTFAEQLKLFLRAYEALTRRGDVDTMADPKRLDASRLGVVMASLTPRLAEARRRGGEANVWQMAGLKRTEVRNATALAALWSPAWMGDRATNFLTGFFRRLHPADHLPSLSELALGYVVRTEHCATGAATERVDITIEGKEFVLAIEVKIGAPEGPGQLPRYINSTQAWARATTKRWCMIFLAPYRTSVPGVVQACWQDVVVAARETLPSVRSDFTHADRLIADFASHVAAF